MNQTASLAASLPPEHRKNLALIVLAKNEPLTDLAAREKVSRRFLYRQKRKATNALNQAFSPISNNQEVLFYLPVTKTWLKQLILALILICHSSYRGVKEILRDLSGTSSRLAGNPLSWRCFSHPISMYTIGFIFRTPSYGGYYTTPKTRDTDGKS